MNLFQRLTYLKEWYDENHTCYSDNRKNHQDAFSKKYKNELRRYTAESKRIKKKRDVDFLAETSISYQDWVERGFQKLLQKLSKTRVEFQKSDFLEQFDIWLKDFAPLDYKFRVYTLELYYKVEIAKFNSQFDRYIVALREGQADWLFSEDEKYHIWTEHHPLYKELQELEFQYDSFADDDIVGNNHAFNRKLIKTNKHIKNRTYIPTSKDSLLIKFEKPNAIQAYIPSYF